MKTMEHKNYDVQLLNVLSYTASQFCFSVQEASVVPFAPMFSLPGSLKTTLAL